MSSQVEASEAVPRALELFHVNYERLKESAERPAERC